MCIYVIWSVLDVCQLSLLPLEGWPVVSFFVFSVCYKAMLLCVLEPAAVTAQTQSQSQVVEVVWDDPVAR